MKRIILLATLFAASTAYAGTVTITFDPEEYEVKIERKSKPVISQLRFESYSSVQRIWTPRAMPLNTVPHHD